MKKIFYLAAIVIAVASCGATKKAQMQTQQPAGTSPFGPVSAMPCEVYDTPEEFAATGIYRGSSYQKGECQFYALENAKQLVYAKYHHTYEGLMSNYGSSYGTNNGNDIKAKMQRAGDAVVHAALNDITASCIRWSNVFDDGMVECYVAIKVSKEDLAGKVSKAIDDVLTPEEKEEIDFEEYQYRKQMQERMKEYKEGQK